jgi:G:T-mismatch repair DNA endonuclease (very short patch repair protein)
MYTPDVSSTICSVNAKRSMVNIPRVENEFLCAARALVTCAAKLRDSPQKFSQLINPNSARSSHRESQRGRAIAMHMATGVSADQPVPIKELYKFENHLDVQAVVISGDFDNQVIYTGSHPRKDKVFLYLKDQHYDAITNIEGFIQEDDNKWCDVCMDIHSAKKICFPVCRACDREECLSEQTETQKKLCTDCNITCNSQVCYQHHKQARTYTRGKKSGKEKPSICQTFFKCLKCGKRMDRTKRDVSKHVCTEYFCKCCSQYVPDDSHLCYFRIKKPKHTSGYFVFFDVETSQDEIVTCGNHAKKPRPDCKHCTDDLMCATCKKCGNCKKAICGVKQHLPNFIVAQTACDHCKSDPFTPEAKCKYCGDRCSACRQKSLQGRITGGDQRPKCSECTLNREHVFSGYDATDMFCKWLLHPTHSHYTTMAHNGRSFDFFFVLHWCVNNGMFPSVTFAGARIMSMKVEKGINMTFCDSLNFLQGRLKSLPKALQLGQELKKGDFPYLFNKQSNFDYVGPLPSPAYYNVDFMNPSDRKEFLEFHASETARGAVFSFKDEILSYTRSDVNILREACLKFRDMFNDITSLDNIGKDGEVTKSPGLDCFAFPTIASCAMHFLREKTLVEYHDLVLKDGREGQGTLKRGQWVFQDNEPINKDDIEESKFVKTILPQPPSRGYSKHFQDSDQAIAWLSWISHKLGRPLMHSRNGGEFRIPSTRYHVDGYDPVDNHVYEFLGCYFHSHLSCIKDGSVRDSRTGKSLYKIARETEDRLKHIRSLGFKVTAIWGCQFDREKKNNPKLQEFLKGLTLPAKPLKIREALYGGRVCPVKLYYKAEPGERICYYDVKSLYPYCCFSKEFPSCHPEIITDQAKMDYTLQSYCGFVKATVLPPRGLYIPILPYRCGGRLKFPLCANCAERETTPPCNCTDKQRSLTGVWTTMELIAALNGGYQIMYIHEVYHYKDTVKGEKGLFHEYVTVFLAIKEQASGYPDWVRSDSDKDAYIQDFFVKQGVMLDKSKISKNPGLRYISKLFLNSLWGKFCQRLDKSKTHYVSTMKQYVKLSNDPTKVISNFHIINEDVVILETLCHEHFPQESSFQNETIGCFTTSHARLHLLGILQQAGDSNLYHDTDSIQWVEKEGETTFKEGYLLGDLTNELPPNVHITEYVSSGPKSYAYMCSDGSCVVKLKGISRNYTNCQTIDMETIKKVVFGEVASVDLPKYNQICKDKYHSIVFNREQKKSYRQVLTKRAIVPGTYNTLPFGY